MITSLLIAFLLLAPVQRVNVIIYAPVVQYCVMSDLKPTQRSLPQDGPLDWAYILPSQAQIEKINKAVLNRKVKYVRDGWDCDDIALEYYVNARKFAHQTIYPKNTALAVGVLFVKIEGPIIDLGIAGGSPRPAYHVLNVFLREDGNWVVVEPQNGKMTLWKSLYYEGNMSVMKILI